jgi:hypothetical protein
MYYQHPPWGFGLIAAIILIIPFYRICKRVGWNPWLGILAGIPLVNLIFWYFLAFSDWPIQKSSAAPVGTAGGPS